MLERRDFVRDGRDALLMGLAVTGVLISSAQSFIGRRSDRSSSACFFWTRESAEIIFALFVRIPDLPQRLLLRRGFHSTSTGSSRISKPRTVY